MPILYILSIFSLHAVLSMLYQKNLIAHHEVDEMQHEGTFTQTSCTIAADHLFLFLDLCAWCLMWSLVLLILALPAVPVVCLKEFSLTSWVEGALCSLTMEWAIKWISLRHSMHVYQLLMHLTRVHTCKVQSSALCAHTCRMFMLFRTFDMCYEHPLWLTIVCHVSVWYITTQCKLFKCVLSTPPAVWIVPGTVCCSVQLQLYIHPMQCLDMFTNVSHFTSSVVLRWSSRTDLVLVCVESLFVLVPRSQAAYYYADIVGISVPSVLSASGQVHSCCYTSTLSFIAWISFLCSGVGEFLWQGLVSVQCRKLPEVVTTTADVLDELGLKEEATQLRG